MVGETHAGETTSGPRERAEKIDQQLENEVIRSELEATQVSLKQLQSRFLSELSAAKRSNSELEQTVSQLQEQLQNIRKEQSELPPPPQPPSWDQSSVQLSALRDEKEATESLLVVTRTELVKLKTAHKELTSDYDCLLQQNSSLAAAHDADRIRIEELETELRSKGPADAAIDASAQAQRDAEDRAKRMEKKLLSLHNKSETLKAAILRRESECQQMYREKEVALQQLEDLRSSTLMMRLQSEEANATVSSLHHKVDQLTNECDEKDREIDSLIESNEKNVEDLAEERDRNEQLRKELEKKQKELRKALVFFRASQQSALFGDGIQIPTTASQFNEQLCGDGVKKKTSGWHLRHSHATAHDKHQGTAIVSEETSNRGNEDQRTAPVTNNATSLMSSLALVTQQPSQKGNLAVTSTPGKSSYFDSKNYFSIPALPRMNAEAIMNAAKDYVSASTSTLAAATVSTSGVDDAEDESQEINYNPFLEDCSDFHSEDGFEEVEFLDNRIFYGGSSLQHASGARSPSTFQRHTNTSSPVPTERDSTTVEGEANSRSNSYCARAAAAAISSPTSSSVKVNNDEDGYSIQQQDHANADGDEVSDDESNDALIGELQDKISSLTVAKLELENRVRELEAELSMNKESLEASHQRSNRLNAKVIELSKVESKLQSVNIEYANTKEELEHTKQLLHELNIDHMRQADMERRVRIVINKASAAGEETKASDTLLQSLMEVLEYRSAQTTPSDTKVMD